MKKVETLGVTYMETKIDVPYFSQYLSVNDTEQSVRACGMTCAYMVLSYYKTAVPPLNEMVERGIREKGLSPSGWVHDYFVELFKSSGLESFREERMLDRDVQKFVEAIAKGEPVIVSAERRIFDQRSFHMVVLTGFKKNEAGELEGFFYHDPASLHPEKAQHLFVSLSVFYLSWRKMAIFISK